MMMTMMMMMMMIHKWIYNAQHSQAKLESETQAVGRWGRFGDEGIKI